MSGALLLALGYSVTLPLYQAKVLLPIDLLKFYPNADPGIAMGWHLVKLFSMNGGWLLFGLGLAIHARVFEPAAAPRALAVTPQAEPSL
jgi:hypothetical protein